MGAARKLQVADLFCGAGGTSTGLALACRELDVAVELLAINHWPRAIETHTKNHPWARHLCARLEECDPRAMVPGGHLDLLVASPECIWHSTARGGKPINDQARSSAWRVLEWCEKLSISNVLIENVPEFQNWGPINSEGRPIKSKKAAIFRQFIQTLEAMNYRVEHRVLNAADFGGATTRRRLFILARKGTRKITWPEPTHAKDATSSIDLFRKGLKPWRAAKEIIDWTIEGESIFARKKPLAPSTIERIAAGLRKFCGPAAEPFIVMLNAHTQPTSVKEPLPTVVAGGNHAALCQPFIIPQNGGGEPRSTESPLPTVATKGAISLVKPFLIPFYGERPGQEPRTHDVDQPMPVLPCSNKFAVVQPFIVQPAHGGGVERRSTSIDAPLPTQPCSNRFALVAPYIVPLNHGKGDHRSYPTGQPMPTLTTLDAWGLVQPFLVKYYSNGDGKVGHSVEEPLDTVTTKDRFGLAEAGVTRVGIDIRFRMLRPHELAAAMGFEKYHFTGSRDEQVKQIGNAVEVNQAKALCKALLEG